MVSSIDETASAMPRTLREFIAVVHGMCCWSLYEHWSDVNDVLYLLVQCYEAIQVVQHGTRMWRLALAT